MILIVFSNPHHMKVTQVTFNSLLCKTPKVILKVSL